MLIKGNPIYNKNRCMLKESAELGSSNRYTECILIQSVGMHNSIIQYLNSIYILIPGTM